MPTQLQLSDIRFGKAEDNIFWVPEEQFFKGREEGILRPNTLPIPNGVMEWKHATFQGQDIYAARAPGLLYLIADTDLFGFCLFKFESTSDDDSSFRVAFRGGNRTITNERSNIIMPNPNLRSVASSFRPNITPGGVNPMSLDGGASYGAQPSVGEGVTGAVDPKRLKHEAWSRGYVAGYVMANAPQTTMYLYRRQQKDVLTCNIQARESKPSRILAVLMALPANCVTRNGAVALPADIRVGAVDFDGSSNSDLLYMSHTVNTAVGYISALGGRLPEYAPTCVEGHGAQHWTPEDILTGKAGVSYVTVRATARSGDKAKSSGVKFNFSLKSTSGRNSLFTQNNIICLRALTHMSTKVNSEQDAYRVNECAFGAWRYRYVGENKSETALQRAMREAPTYIWQTQYTIEENGEKKTVDGIGSRYFAYGQSVTTDNGETLNILDAEYFPWWMTGDLKENATPSRVEQIVKRTFRAAEGNKKDGMIASPVTLRDNPKDPLFKPYEKFMNLVEKMGFLTHDQLLALGTRTSTKSKKSTELDSEQLNSLTLFLEDSKVADEIEQVRDQASRRMTLLARG